MRRSPSVMSRAVITNEPVSSSPEDVASGGGAAVYQGVVVAAPGFVAGVFGPDLLDFADGQVVLGDVIGPVVAAPGMVTVLLYYERIADGVPAPASNPPTRWTCRRCLI